MRGQPIVDHPQHTKRQNKIAGTLLFAPLTANGSDPRGVVTSATVNNTTAWQATTAAGWAGTNTNSVKFQFVNPVIVRFITMTLGSAVSVTIAGSTDNTNWNTLITSSSSGVFTINTNVAYIYYRFTCGGSVTISGVQFYGN